MIRELAWKRTFRWAILAAVAFFVYFMGAVLIIRPDTRTAALEATPLALSISTVVLFAFARFRFGIRSVTVCAVIVLAGYLVEVAGVNTGVLFGNYAYGDALGIKVWHTPLLIGVNWLFVTFACAGAAALFRTGNSVRAVTASVLMVAYDLVLEQAAPGMDMWRWGGEAVPFRNYASWFLLALGFQFWVHRSGLPLRNAAAVPLLLFQVGLFVAVILFVG